MRFGLPEDIITKLSEVFEANSKVDKAIVFGSRAKGNYRPDSDIDIAIKGVDITLNDILKLQVAFEETGINVKVDLVHYDAVKEQALLEHIDRVGIELYSRWKKRKLGDIALVVMGQSPPGETCNQKGEGLPLLNGPSEFTAKNPIPVQYTTDPKRICEETDILFCVRGSTTGRMNWADQKYAIGRGIASIRHKSGKNLQPFLKGLLDYTLPQLLSKTTGSVFPNITGDDLKEQEILLPPLAEQAVIGEVLRTLDNKIDLLHRQNKTLEQLAETLFRQWFVENANESWSEKSLHEIADHYKENIHPFKFPNKYFHHFSLPAFDDGKYPKAELGSEILSNKYKVIPYSILISKLNPRFPRIWELFGNDIPENSICSTEFQVVKPKELKYFAFIYYYLKSNEVTQELASAAGGTSGSHQRVSPDDIFNLSFLMPPIDLIEKFDSITKEQLGKIKSNTLQIQTLTKLRDTLLPKLMNGEVRINLGDSRLTNPSKNKKANVRQ